MRLSHSYSVHCQLSLAVLYPLSYYNSIKMAGGDDAAAAKDLKGMSKIFNGVTMRGRANVAMATYAAVGVIALYFTLKPKAKK